MIGGKILTGTLEKRQSKQKNKKSVSLWDESTRSGFLKPPCSRCGGCVLPWKLTNVPWKSMVGRCISYIYWNSPFLGVILVFRGVNIRILDDFWWPSSLLPASVHCGKIWSEQFFVGTSNRHPDHWLGIFLGGILDSNLKCIFVCLRVSLSHSQTIYNLLIFLFEGPWLNIYFPMLVTQGLHPTYLVFKLLSSNLRWKKWNCSLFLIEDEEVHLWVEVRSCLVSLDVVFVWWAVGQLLPWDTDMKKHLAGTTQSRSPCFNGNLRVPPQCQPPRNKALLRGY